MITFSGVSLIYPNAQRTIVEDISFTVNEGELLLLIGHTGAGKSSLLKLINGLIPITLEEFSPVKSALMAGAPER